MDQDVGHTSEYVNFEERNTKSLGTQVAGTKKNDTPCIVWRVLATLE